MNYYKKAIVITKHKHVLTTIKNALKKHAIDIENRYPNLYSIQSIKDNLIQKKSASFIKTDLATLFKDHGFPYLIIIDHRIEFGISNINDLDGRMVFRTFLIAYVILSRAKNINNLTGNFLLIGDESEEEEMDLYDRKPLKVIDSLKTNNEIVNSFFKEMRKNPTIYKNLFYIKGINKDQQLYEIAESVENYIYDIKDRLKSFMNE